MKRISTRPLWLVCPVLLALIGVGLRIWQKNSAFEGELNLPIRHAPASVALTCLLILSAAVILLLTVTQREETPLRGAEHKAWRSGAMLAKGDRVCLTLMVVAAFTALIAGPALMLQGWQLRQEHMQILATGGEHSNNGTLMMVTGVTSLLAFGGLLMAGRDRFRGIREGKGEQAIMLAAVNGGLWLMESYRCGAADPVLWNYVPLLVAIVCGMLFYMDCAGLAAGAPHPRRTLCLAGITVVISAVAIPGGRDLGSVLLLCAQILAALAVLWRLPVNMEHPPAVEVPAAPKEEIQEENQDV